MTDIVDNETAVSSDGSVVAPDSETGGIGDPDNYANAADDLVAPGPALAAASVVATGSRGHVCAAVSTADAGGTATAWFYVYHNISVT